MRTTPKTELDEASNQESHLNAVIEQKDKDIAALSHTRDDLLRQIEGLKLTAAAETHKVRLDVEDRDRNLKSLQKEASLTDYNICGPSRPFVGQVSDATQELAKVRESHAQLESRRRSEIDTARSQSLDRSQRDESQLEQLCVFSAYLQEMRTNIQSARADVTAITTQQASLADIPPQLLQEFERHHNETATWKGLLWSATTRHRQVRTLPIASRR